MEEVCRIFIVDDHKIFRDGLKLLIKKIKWVEVIGEARNGESLRKLLTQEQPDVILMDIQMPMEDGISASRYIRQYFPDIKIIAMTVYNDSYTISKMLDAGASGYLTKDVTRSEFEKALQKVCKGGSYMMKASRSVYEKGQELKLNNNEPEAPIQLQELTKRELEILKLIAKGFSSKDIAEELDISYRTVEKHRYKMLRKMGVGNVSELLYKLTQYKIL